MTKIEQKKFPDPKKEITEMLAVFKNQDQWPHLASELGLKRYIKMADQLARNLPPGKILDWGAGCGQMSYLLKNRGFEVVSYDINSEERPLLKLINQTITIGSDPVNLPFPDASFDAVLSSGVLEHVADADASLKEVFRVLKKQGYFSIYMLPNKYSYIEFISDRIGRGDHPVKYSLPEIKTFLNRQGFEVLSTGYQNFFPYNLKGFPRIIRQLYHLLDKFIGPLDRLFVNFPFLKHLSTNIIVVAKKI